MLRDFHVWRRSLERKWLTPSNACPSRDLWLIEDMLL
jgi:hypothetical protein